MLRAISVRIAKNTSRFPVIQKYFDDIINNDMAGAGTASGMLMDGVTVELKPMTDQQALLLRELVDKAGHNVRYDVNIYDIVTEDAQGFLSGSKISRKSSRLSMTE